MSDFDDRHYAICNAWYSQWRYLSPLRTERPCWFKAPRHGLTASDAVDLLAWAEGKWPWLVGKLEVVDLRGGP